MTAAYSDKEICKNNQKLILSDYMLSNKGLQLDLTRFVFMYPKKRLIDHPYRVLGLITSLLSTKDDN